jgi:putative ABC transport system permease protein
MAIGADQRNVLCVLWMVLRQSVGLIAVGLVLGIVGALALTRLISGWLYNVPPTDPATFAGVALVLLSAAMVAALLPALRATRVDPLIALRAEG